MWMIRFGVSREVMTPAPEANRPRVNVVTTLQGPELLSIRATSVALALRGRNCLATASKSLTIRPSTGSSTS
jgi:hypothetical protein